LRKNDDEQMMLFSLWWLIKHTVIHICSRNFLGDKIIQTEINGNPNVITFRNKAKAVLQAWNDMMQLAHEGEHPGKSSVMFLLMIDIKPSDVMCVYSTLRYIEDHAHHHNVKPIITFHQPFRWKALMIIVTEPVESKLKNIVLHLGGFHTEMSFLGSIGRVMAVSGLQELLELIYTPNAVAHMLSEKAVA